MSPPLAFTLNGAPATIGAEETLLDALRERLGVTEVKTGCAIGRCGACTVLLDGAAVNACLLSGWQVAGRAITTIAGLAALPVGETLAAAMEEENAFQCGYCAPGVMMTLAGLLSARPLPDDARIAEALEGNLCRCTGYHSILRGARTARDRLKDLP